MPPTNIVQNINGGSIYISKLSIFIKAFYAKKKTYPFKQGLFFLIFSLLLYI